MDVHVVPLFVVFHTPPVARPMYIVLGSFSTTAMSSIRPPIFAGPMGRQTNGRRIGSSDWLTGGGRAGTGGGPWASRVCAANAHNPSRSHVPAGTRTTRRFTNVSSIGVSAAEVHLRRLPGFGGDLPVRVFLELEHLRREVGREARTLRVVIAHEL